MTATTVVNSASLLETLSLEHELMSSLRVLMSAEQAMSPGEPGFEEHLAAKAELLGKIETTTLTRETWLRDNDFGADRDGMARCIDSIPQQPALKKRFEALCELAAECQQSNQVLARSNRRKQDFFSRLTANLGLHPGPGEPVYSPSGEPSVENAGRLLGSA